MTDDDLFERNLTFPAFPPVSFHPRSGFPQMLSVSSLSELSIMQKCAEFRGSAMLGAGKKKQNTQLVLPCGSSSHHSLQSQRSSLAAASSATH